MSPDRQRCDRRAATSYLSRLSPTPAEHLRGAVDRVRGEARVCRLGDSRAGPRERSAGGMRHLTPTVLGVVAVLATAIALTGCGSRQHVETATALPVALVREAR